MLFRSECQQQRPYVASVNVSICHDNDAVIAQLVDIEVVTSDPATQSSNERADFRGRQHFVEWECTVDSLHRQPGR